jgi:hypothetical protein
MKLNFIFKITVKNGKAPGNAGQWAMGWDGFEERKNGGDKLKRVEGLCGYKHTVVFVLTVCWPQLHSTSLRSQR